jgi:hypothetical protein
LRLLLAQLKLELEQMALRIEEADTVIERRHRRTTPVGGWLPSLAWHRTSYGDRANRG